MPPMPFTLNSFPSADFGAPAVVINLPTGSPGEGRFRVPAAWCAGWCDACGCTVLTATQTTRVAAAQHSSISAGWFARGRT